MAPIQMLRLASTVILALGAAGAPAGTAVAAGVFYPGPVWPGYVPAYPALYPGYLYPGACPYFGVCAGPWWDERRLRNRPVAPSDPPPAEMDIWGSTGSPWGYVRRLPPPTPESQIQPRYREASTIRPEFGGP